MNVNKSQLLYHEILSGKEASAPKRSKIVDSDDENEPQEYEEVNGETTKPLLDGESSDEGVDKNENDNNTLVLASTTSENPYWDNWFSGNLL